MHATLASWNIFLGNRRTSTRLEPELWDCLEDIAKCEGIRFHDLIQRIHRDRGIKLITRALRVFCVMYYREMAG